MPEIRLSASLYQRFLTCPKSAVFSIDPEAKALERPTLGAALGMVSHSLVENSVKIPQDWSPELIGEWFEKNWEAFVQEQYSELIKNWAPNPVPKPHTWRGYFATRASAKTLVLKNSGLLPPKSSVVSNSVASTKEGYALKFPLVEKFLVSEDIGILGKPDFIFLENGKATIYDYKFGNNQEDLDKHKIQMFFYQLLVEYVLKIEVGKLAIVASANRIWEISTNRQELEKLKSDIPRVIEALSSNKVAARPSTSNCFFCPFKSICEPFKNAKLEINPNRPMAIAGLVLQTRKVDEDFQELIIKPDNGYGQTEIKVFGIPNGYSVKTGNSVFLTDKLDFVDEKVIGFSWNSRISIQD